MEKDGAANRLIRQSGAVQLLLRFGRHVMSITASHVRVGSNVAKKSKRL